MSQQHLLPFLVLLVAALSANAQVEPNDPNGRLQSSGVDPVAGAPFQVPSTGGMISIEVGGLPQSPYIFLAGNYAAPGTVIPILGNQVLNLDMGGGIAIIGDGIGGTGLQPYLKRTSCCCKPG